MVLLIRSMRRRPSVMTRAVMDFNFGAAPVDADPCYVTLHVENTGTVESSWEFFFPSDLQTDLEHWSESGDFTNDELHEVHLKLCWHERIAKLVCYKPQI